MGTLFGNVFVGLCCAVLSMNTGEISPVPLTANHHPWGQFPPSSWCIVQTDTVSNVEGRAVRTLQTVRTTLMSIDDSGITLHESEALEVGGQAVEKLPQTVKYDFFQEPIRENVRIHQGQPQKLMIGRNVVPCAVRIYERQVTGGHHTTTIWYTPYVYPYIIRVEKILRSVPDVEGAGEQIIRHSVMFVQETSALKSFRSSRRNRTYTLRMVEKAGNTTKTTDARCSWDVPGGLLEATIRETDAQGKEIRRSVSRMTNYYSFHQLQTHGTWAAPAPVEAAK